MSDNNEQGGGDGIKRRRYQSVSLTADLTRAVSLAATLRAEALLEQAIKTIGSQPDVLKHTRVVAGGKQRITTMLFDAVDRKTTQALQEYISGFGIDRPPGLDEGEPSPFTVSDIKGSLRNEFSKVVADKKAVAELKRRTLAAGGRFSYDPNTSVANVSVPGSALARTLSNRIDEANAKVSEVTAQEMRNAHMLKAARDREAREAIKIREQAGSALAKLDTGTAMVERPTVESYTESMLGRLGDADMRATAERKAVEEHLRRNPTSPAALLLKDRLDKKEAKLLKLAGGGGDGDGSDGGLGPDEGSGRKSLNAIGRARAIGHFIMAGVAIVNVTLNKILKSAMEIAANTHDLVMAGYQLGMSPVEMEKARTVSKSLGLEENTLAKAYGSVSRRFNNPLTLKSSLDALVPLMQGDTSKLLGMINAHQSPQDIFYEIVASVFNATAQGRGGVLTGKTTQEALRNNLDIVASGLGQDAASFIAQLYYSMRDSPSGVASGALTGGSIAGFINGVVTGENSITGLPTAARDELLLAESSKQSRTLSEISTFWQGLGERVFQEMLRILLGIFQILDELTFGIQLAIDPSLVADKLAAAMKKNAADTARVEATLAGIYGDSQRGLGEYGKWRLMAKAAGVTTEEDFIGKIQNTFNDTSLANIQALFGRDATFATWDQFGKEANPSELLAFADARARLASNRDKTVLTLQGPISGVTLPTTMVSNEEIAANALANERKRVLNLGRAYGGQGSVYASSRALAGVLGAGFSGTYADAAKRLKAAGYTPEQIRALIPGIEQEIRGVLSGEIDAGASGMLAKRDLLLGDIENARGIAEAMESGITTVRTGEDIIALGGSLKDRSAQFSSTAVLNNFIENTLYPAYARWLAAGNTNSSLRDDIYRAGTDANGNATITIDIMENGRKVDSIPLAVTQTATGLSLSNISGTDAKFIQNAFTRYVELGGGQ